ncbi:protein PIN-LIKES 3-like isoform X2 [Silene latifolia]|uniref:protein PIN-LIKES 3-like isoform X2 n=1 Tax=Silene latifolia TaxID=37657 RepID=UPI003D774C49
MHTYFLFNKCLPFGENRFSIPYFGGFPFIRGFSFISNIVRSSSLMVCSVFFQRGKVICQRSLEPVRGNLGVLPIIIIPAICNQPGSPFGAADVCNHYGLAYASLSMATGSIFLWLYVYNIVRITSNKKVETITAQGCDGIDKQPGGLTVVNIPDSERLSSSEFTQTPTVDVVQRLPCTHQSAAGSVDNFSSSNKFMVASAFKIRQGLRNTCKNMNLKAVLAPTTIAAAVGIFIGMIPPFRKLLFGKSSPLRVVGDTITFIKTDLCRAYKI